MEWVGDNSPSSDSKIITVSFKIFTENCHSAIIINLPEMEQPDLSDNLVMVSVTIYQKVINCCQIVTKIVMQRYNLHKILGFSVT